MRNVSYSSIFLSICTYIDIQITTLKFLLFDFDRNPFLHFFHKIFPRASIPLQRRTDQEDVNAAIVPFLYSSESGVSVSRIVFASIFFSTRDPRSSFSRRFTPPSPPTKVDFHIHSRRGRGGIRKARGSGLEPGQKRGGEGEAARGVRVF